MPAPTITRPGVFRHDGETYVVKFNQSRTRLYAQRVVNAPSDRLMEDGSVRRLELAYAQGMMYTLTEDNRLTLEQAEAISRQYGRCLCCGRTLRRAESVRQMIGPVCAQSFFGTTGTYSYNQRRPTVSQQRAASFAAATQHETGEDL